LYQTKNGAENVERERERDVLLVELRSYSKRNE